MEKRSGARPLIRAAAFLLCLAVVYSGITSIVAHAAEAVPWVNTFRIRELYNLKTNSVDVVSLGSSMTICSFSPMDLYRDYGICAYNAGGERQPVMDSYLILNELLKRQRPQIVLLEVFGLYYDSGEEFFRKSFDGLKWSDEKRQVLNDLSSNYLDDSKLSYIFPIMKFHNRFREINKTDFTEASREDYYQLFRGYALITGKYSPDQPMVPMQLDEAAYEEPREQALEYFYKIIKICRENNVELVLYKTPVGGNTPVGGDWQAARYNAVKNLAEENELPYIDFNLQEVMMESRLDFTVDQADAAHQNSSGAVKLTKYLGRYLHENYDLPDRRGDPDYAYLDQELERYEREKSNERLIQTCDLSSYLELLPDMGGGYTVIISARDEAVNGLSEELRGQLKKFGFQCDLTPENAYRHSLIGVWQDGRMVYEDFSEGVDNPERDALEFQGVLPDGMKYYVKSAGWEAGDTSSIIIDGVERSKNGRGMNIVVYDSVGGRVVDSVAFDTCADAGITFFR